MDGLLWLSHGDIEEWLDCVIAARLRVGFSESYRTKSVAISPDLHFVLCLHVKES